MWDRGGGWLISLGGERGRGFTHSSPTDQKRAERTDSGSLEKSTSKGIMRSAKMKIISGN